jgi:hypothetical protein
MFLQIQIQVFDDHMSTEAHQVGAQRLDPDPEPLAFYMRCYTCKKHKFLLNKGPSIRSPLLFVRGATRVKNISFLLNKGSSIQSLLLFIRGATRVKSINVC